MSDVRGDGLADIHRQLGGIEATLGHLRDEGARRERVQEAINTRLDTMSESVAQLAGAVRQLVDSDAEIRPRVQSLAEWRARLIGMALGLSAVLSTAVTVFGNWVIRALSSRPPP